MRRILVKALALAGVSLVLLGTFAYWYLRRSLPAIDGTVAVTGLSSPVDIVRDADGIPHITASTKFGALFGLGYVHAQDRLWQMEFQRRVGHGRLSEIFGAVTIAQDRFLRTIGFGRAARAAWEIMPEPTRQQVIAYVSGVNAFLASHHGSELPPEFALLRFEPAPWEPVDVVLWGKMMAWDLSANYSFELLRQDISAQVGEQKLADLMPPYAPNGLSILTERDARALTRVAGPSAPTVVAARPASPASPRFVRSSLAALASGLSTGLPAVSDFLLGGATTEALGSNNWVVDGTMTASGKPLLANDPHLGTRLPSTWYLAHMSAGDFDVIGGTLPGTPAVVLGRNRFIAWGMTNVAADVEDLYRERLDTTGTRARFRGGEEPVQVVTETIAVKNRPSVRVDVRLTRHGPLISDAINANETAAPASRRQAPLEPLAFRWTALDPGDTTIAATLQLDAARNWSDFTDAMRLFVVPSQNFVYADIEGHIGYYAPGRIPIRARGDGSIPADGSSGEMEWTGWVPFDELPHAFDPPEHFIVTANQRPAPPDYPYLLGLEWPEPYRAQRVIDRLRGRSLLRPDDFTAIQSDTLSLHAQALLPLLLSRARPESAQDRQALALLHSWNYDARGDSAPTAIFEAWFLRLAPNLAGDELGPLVTEDYQGRFSFVTRFVTRALASSDALWCDDVRTPQRETCEDVVSRALHEAMAQLTRQLGTDLDRWRWDAVHHAVFPHQLGTIATLRRLLSRTVPSAGDWSTVNVGAVSVTHPFEQHSVAGYREVIDLSPANDSRFLDAVGESGHFLSKHYDDFLEDWRAVRHRPMRMDRNAIEMGATGHLRLVPR